MKILKLLREMNNLVVQEEINAVWKPCSALRNSKGGALDRADSALVAQVNEHPHDELNVAFGNRWDIFKQHYFWVQQFHGTQK
jgi:hypothetical protein